MLYRIIVCRSDGSAFVERIRSAVPDVFPASSFHAGQPALLVTYETGSVRLESSYNVVRDPEIISGSTRFKKAILPPEIVATLPHVVQMKGGK